MKTLVVITVALTSYGQPQTHTIQKHGPLPDMGCRDVAWQINQREGQGKKYAAWCEDYTATDAADSLITSPIVQPRTTRSIR